MNLSEKELASLALLAGLLGLLTSELLTNGLVASLDLVWTIPTRMLSGLLIGQAGLLYLLEEE